MNDVTRILSAIDRGDGQKAAELLPLVYQELRKLAEERLSRERPGHTLQPTALVHEAYVRLVGSDASLQAGPRHWNGRGHFFAAAAEAMRRILVERARRRQCLRHGGGRQRVELDQVDLLTAANTSADAQEHAVDLLAIDEALTRLSAVDEEAAQVVKLRYFAGLTIEEAADAMGTSVRTANRSWAYAKAWLFRQLEGDGRAGR